ncbi:histidyl-tRNA synthetase [Intrasporangium oryzae NRRL B-24470]|uniref:Histidyl-tRNA synthetase n=1 Tax=Intrasporangium oryzae NRRL B-24470 TaxID=1386089 RepID=W9G7V7_9MICO|nr:L-histidine N(alpha)-methyltransferase [Intrasporangium oryzae]EWS99948.1 histidyl-tRNA synthetase [Intrasporangium oryzae NRRL B-24470]
MRGREPVVTVVLDPNWASGALVDDVRRGLGSQPRTLPPKWLYDDVGSELFDEITRLPEYYPTERERSILREHADDIVAACDATTFVELGSGTSDKTRLLLDAFTSRGRLARFVPVDVSDATLRQAAKELSERYPSIRVEAVVGDFTLHLGHLPRGDRRLVAFLGGTIGNLYVEERAAFLGALADSLDPGDWLLLGTDLVKSPERIIAAYDDSRGVTAAFVSNCLRVLNRELGADFDLDAFTYVPFWDPRMERMDLRLRAEMPQRVAIPGAGITFDLFQGEEIRVEISTKFRPDRLRDELAAVGFGVTRVWTDRDGDFALTLARREG